MKALVLTLVLFLAGCSGADKIRSPFFSMKYVCVNQPKSQWCTKVTGRKKITYKQAKYLMDTYKLSYQHDIGEEWNDAHESGRWFGDCEDSALMWGSIAAERGIDKRDISIVVGEGHAWLEIGEYYLDIHYKTPIKSNGKGFYKYNMGKREWMGI